MKAVSRDEEPMDPEMQQRLPLYERQKVDLITKTEVEEEC